MDNGRTSARKTVKVEELEEPPGFAPSPANLVNLHQPNKPQKTLSPAGQSRRSGLLVKVSKTSREFAAKYFPETSLAQWSDWHWQLNNTIRSAEQLSRFISLSDEEKAALSRRRASLPMRITPYYLSLVDPLDLGQAIRRAVVPVDAEFLHLPEEARDPLAEDSHSPVPGVIHRYPDRVLFLATTTCLVCCRYCTRSRAVGNASQYHLNRANWEKAIAI